jgi:hypothetical protein
MRQCRPSRAVWPGLNTRPLLPKTDALEAFGMSNSTISQAAEDKHVPIGAWKLSAEVYDRIIDAVGEEPKDRDKLVFDLLSARAQLLRFMFLDSDKGAKARKKLFSDISNQAIALKDNLLANEEYAARALFPDVSRGLIFLRELHRIVEEAKVSEQQNSKGAWERLERSLPDWFAAEILPKVLKAIFLKFMSGILESRLDFHGLLVAHTSGSPLRLWTRWAFPSSETQ